MSSTQTKSREGAYRDKALSHYGEACQECGWEPDSEVERPKLHVHLEDPQDKEDPTELENLAVLCRDCHLAKHSKTAFSHELVGNLTRSLAGPLTHKQDGFVDRVARRVRLDTVYQVDSSPPVGFAETVEEYTLVEGLLDGDFYDSYFVDVNQPYLSMCSCYTHSFGVHRAHTICTHVGATIIRLALLVEEESTEEEAMEFARLMGKELNEKAEEYVKKQELIETGLDTLDIEDRFSSSWEQRAQAQAKKMTQYGSEWKCFGSECEGCEIRFTAEGYKCTDAQDKGWEEKWPCPGKLGAYILDETGGQTQTLNIDEGHIFKVTREREDLPAEKGDFLISISVDDSDETVLFRRFESENVRIDFDIIVDAILAGTLKTENLFALEQSLDSARVITDNNGIPSELAPDVEEQNAFRVQTDTLGYLTEGDLIAVIDTDDDSREIIVEKVSLDNPLGGEQHTLSYEDVLEHLRNTGLEQIYISDEIDIIFTKVAEKSGKTWVAISSPYEAKDDIKSLDYGKTERSWSNPVNRKWNIKSESLEYAVDELEKSGWSVWVPLNTQSDL